MVVDVESKCLYNGFPYSGKDLMRSGDASIPTDVVMTLMSPLFRQGFNVTCDNYFTSLNFSLRLAKQHCSLAGTIRANRRGIPDLLKKKLVLHDTMVLHSTGDTTATTTFSQCKQSKSVNILSTLHKEVVIPEHNNPKRKPEAMLFYNQTKVGADVLDQMSRFIQ